jgi:hypothetical protein
MTSGQPRGSRPRRGPPEQSTPVRPKLFFSRPGAPLPRNIRLVDNTKPERMEALGQDLQASDRRWRAANPPRQTPEPASLSNSGERGPPSAVSDAPDFDELAFREIAEGRALGEVLLGFDAAQKRGRGNADNSRLEPRPRSSPHRFFAAHWVREIDVRLTDRLLASAEHSKLRFEPSSSAKNVIACFALRSI